MKPKGDLLMSSLVAGAAFGVVSGVPILGILNCLCCSLIIGAGATATFLLVRSSQEPVDYGRAALAGTLAGAVAAPVWLVTTLAFTFLSGRNLQEQFEEAIEQSSKFVEGGGEAAGIIAALGAPVLALFMLCLLEVICVPFGLAGGLLGRLIFERRTTPPPAQAGSQGPITPASNEPPFPPPPTPPEASA